VPISINDTIFDSNVASVAGGAISFHNELHEKSVYITDNTFMANRAYRGGALRTSGPNTFVLEDNEFDSNEAELGENYSGDPE